MSAQNPDLTPRTKRRRRRQAGSYSYYLQDHPVLVPALTLALGGLCLYVTVFSNVMERLLMREGTDRSVLDQFYTVTGWGVAFVISIMFLSLIFLLLHGIDAGLRRVRRRPLVCTRCGLVEDRPSLSFVREPLEDTADLDRLTCPQCGNVWFVRE